MEMGQNKINWLPQWSAARCEKCQVCMSLNPPAICHWFNGDFSNDCTFMFKKLGRLNLSRWWQQWLTLQGWRGMLFPNQLFLWVTTRCWLKGLCQNLVPQQLQLHPSHQVDRQEDCHLLNVRFPIRLWILLIFLHEWCFLHVLSLPACPLPSILQVCRPARRFVSALWACWVGKLIQRSGGWDRGWWWGGTGRCQKKTCIS